MNNATLSSYLFAGKAVFTITSQKTGTSFTYRVTTKDDANVSFVSVLTGPNNETDYAYVGIIPHDAKDRFIVTKKSRISADAPSAKAFGWFLKNHESDQIAMRHNGRCGRCGRTLTTPESIDTGLGPICAEKG